jgi:hypothetical protein
VTKPVRWDAATLAAFEKKKAASKTPTPMQRFQALGRLPKGKMNKTEAAYAALLEQQKREGRIIDYKFHPMNIRLADRTFYEVDFLVLHADMTLAIHETKGGFTTDKGQMKIKVCAEAMPWFRFLKCVKQAKKDGGGWKIEEFNE